MKKMKNKRRIKALSQNVRDLWCMVHAHNSDIAELSKPQRAYERLRKLEDELGQERKRSHLLGVELEAIKMTKGLPR